MDYDALIRDLRSSAKAFRENSVYDSEGDPVRLIVQADEADKAADAIANLRARNEALREALWEMLHAVCHETGFAAAVREDSGLAYPWEPLDQAERQARAALAANREG